MILHGSVWESRSVPRKLSKKASSDELAFFFCFLGPERAASDSGASAHFPGARLSSRIGSTLREPRARKMHICTTLRSLTACGREGEERPVRGWGMRRALSLLRLVRVRERLVRAGEDGYREGGDVAGGLWLGLVIACLRWLVQLSESAGNLMGRRLLLYFI